MKHIHVTCAIIERDGLVLVAQRSASMSMPLKWEFPGGKIDPGETEQQCLEREVFEELGVKVNLIRALESSIHDYPQFRITLYPFVCSLVEGNITLHEHASVIWSKPSELYLLDWADADIAVLREYLKRD